MSVEHLAVVLHHSRAKGTAKLVLIGIANHAGDGGAWPSLSTLARYANVDVRSAQRALSTLQGLGEVRVSIQAGGGAAVADSKRPNRYDVSVECPPWCDRTPQHRDTRRHSGRQAELWTDPVTPVSPGDASVTPPLTPVSPHRVTPVSPKPSLEPSINTSGSSPASTTEPDRRLCTECHMPAWYCTPRQHLSGHTFRPRTQPTRALTDVDARAELHKVLP